MATTKSKKVTILGKRYDEYTSYGKHYTEDIFSFSLDDYKNFSFEKICDQLSVLKNLTKLEIIYPYISEGPNVITIDKNILKLKSLNQLKIKGKKNSEIVIEDFNCPHVFRSLELDASNIFIKNKTLNFHQLDISASENIEFHPECSFQLAERVKILGKVNELPLDLFYAENLKNLYIGGTDFQTAPNDAKLPLLETLSIFQNDQLDNINPLLINASNLEELSLSYTSITHLPEEVQFNSLHKLSIYINPNLTVLPAKLLYSENLETIKIEKTPIESLEHCFTDKVNYSLKTLVIQDTNIEVLPAALLNGKHQLRNYLELRNNKLKSIPSQLINTTSIHQFNGGGNPFERFDVPLEENNSLWGFDIDGHQFKTIDENLFQLKGISSLNIQSEKLSDISRIHEFSSIKFLDINLSVVEKGWDDLFKLKKMSSVDTHKMAGIVCSILSNDIKKRLIKLILEDVPYEKYSNFELIHSLCISNDHIKKDAESELKRRVSAPLIINKESLFYIMGKNSESKSAIKEKLSTINIEVKARYSKDVTHLIVGKMPKEVLKFEENQVDQCTLCDENSITKYQNTIAPTYLMEDDKQLIENLNQLLDSDEYANLNIAIELMKSGGIPPVLFEKVFYVMHYHTNYKRLLPLLEKYAPNEYLEVLKVKLKTKRYFYIENEFRYLIRSKFEKVMTSEQITAFTTFQYRKNKMGTETIFWHAPLFSEIRKEVFLDLNLIGKEEIDWVSFNKGRYYSLPIPKDLPHFSKIKRFSMSYKKRKLIFLQDNLFEYFKDLEELYLSGLSLDSFDLNDKEVKALSKLKKLDLSDNDIKCLPPRLKELKSLKELKITGNQLSETYEELKEALPNCEIQC